MADKKAQNIIIKKIKKGHGGHHGGAWKVAFADFMTALMCFFLVMWLMGSDEETKQAIANYFNNPNSHYKTGRDPSSTTFAPMGEKSGDGESIMKGLDGEVPEALVKEPSRPVSDQDYKANKELAELAKEIMDNQVYAIEVTVEYVKFSVSEDLIFQPGSAVLREDAQKYLDRLGQLFKGYKGYIRIEGFLDTPPKWIGPFSNAYEFTLARSVAVMSYMIDHIWVAEDRMTPSGGGTRDPVASNDVEALKKKNRRMQFTLSYQKNEK